MRPTLPTRVLQFRIAGVDLERAHPMPITGFIIFGGFVAFAFDRVDVDDSRLGCVLSALHRLVEGLQIVPVDRSDVGEAHVVKHGGRNKSRLDIVLQIIVKRVDSTA